MKKRIKILLVLFFFGGIAYILWPRSLKRMETIARHELRDYVDENIFYELNGPLINEQEEFVEFVWYKKLEWGDSSKIFIKVYRSIFSCDKYNSGWRNFGAYVSPSITMNYQWYYFLFSEDGTSNFEEIFPSGRKGINVISSVVEMRTDSLKEDGFEFMVPAVRLIYFLKKGYFEVLEQESETTIIAFYEPIINIYRENKRDTIPLMTAKVLESDTSGIKIQPYDFYNVLKKEK